MTLSPDIYRLGADSIHTLANLDQQLARILKVAKDVGTLLRRTQIGHWDIAAIAMGANNFQRKAQREGLTTESASVREVDQGATAKTLEALNGAGGRVIIMRHGGQVIHRQLVGLPNDLLKIRQMQVPFNTTDPLAAHSHAEAIGTAAVLRAAQEISGKSLRILTSQNARALQLALIIAEAANAGSFPIVDTRLNCPNYRSVDVTDEQLLAWLAQTNGSLPWEMELVNRVCGAGTFERITRDVDCVITEGLANPHTITLCITHTQQTNACDVREWKPPTRYAELGMRIIQPQTSLLLKNGIYAR